MGKRTADWLKFECGNIVRDKRDIRHEGTVVAVISGTTVKIKWNETGWYSEVNARHVELVPVEPVYGPGFHRMMARMGEAKAEAVRQDVLAGQRAAMAADALPPLVTRDRTTYRDYPKPKR